MDIIEELENRLDSFDKNVRLEALSTLQKKVNTGEVCRAKKTNFINLHCHTFFSFNAYGYSPAHIAWRAFKEGLEIVGIVDFDVLDGVDEVLEAGKVLNIKTVAGLETRVFIEEYSDKIINSPNEQGIYYLMGTGFYKKPPSGSESNNVLLKMGSIAKRRNLMILEKINDFLPEIRIDYERDVLQLTPQGNATERHILIALDEKARNVFNNDPGKLISFWSNKLQVDSDKLLSVLHDRSDLQGLIRSRLMKYGTVGYILPERVSFPLLEEVIGMVENTDSLPAAAWLDGTNEGEKNIEEFLQFLIKKGIVLLNIIPDRNWNIGDKKDKEIKLKNLDEVIRTAGKLNLPIIAGTEMNKCGQKFVDDFTAPELSPYLERFCAGAFFVYGHTQMGRFSDKGYNSKWAKKYLPDRVERNSFYMKIGKLIQPQLSISLQGGRLEERDDSISPYEILHLFEKGLN